MASSGANLGKAYTNNPSIHSSPQEEDWNEQEMDAAKKGRGEGNEEGVASNLTRSARQNPQKIPENCKERIVELFATFHTHRQVSEIIKEEFHLDISRHTLAIYDPERVACQLGKRLRRYYAAVRERYANSAKETALAHQAHRLRQLENIVDLATKAKDFGNAIKALEVAAKEMGGLLEAGNSKLTVEHRGTVGHVHATVEEARKEVAMRLAGLLENAPQLQAAITPDTAPEEESADIHYIDFQEDGEEGDIGGQAIE